MPANPNGVVAWSDADRVLILTGLRAPSTNRKTGRMVQGWILARAEDPVAAVRSGLDAKVCPSTCPLRGDKGAGRGCYVNLGQAPLSVWRAYNRGAYLDADWTALRTMLRGKAVRFGAYGDPAMVPVAVLERVARYADRWTAYTHAWAEIPADHAKRLRRLAMASVESEADAAVARASGWRTFRIGLDKDPGREIWCPATVEGGASTTCDRCGLCAGASNGGRSIVVAPHGAGSGHARRILDSRS